MAVRLTFLGTGNAFSDGGRSHACIHVGAPGCSLLLDCGGSALPAIKRTMDPGAIDAIAISHLHGDHFGGIPYLILEQHFAGRTAPLTVAGPGGLPGRLRAAEASLYPDFFGRRALAFEVRELALDASEAPLGGAMVSAHPVTHIRGTEPHGLRVRVGGRLIAYSGDATWTDELPRLAKGADLFICESMQFARADRAHVTYRTLMEHRDELDCGRIVLTHLGAEMLAHLDEVELECAADGTAIEI